MIHGATVSAYSESLQKLPSDLKETMGDLLWNPAFAGLVTAMGFVGVDADIEQARTAMRSVLNCNDVFATSDGKSSGSVQAVAIVAGSEPVQ